MPSVPRRGNEGYEIINSDIQSIQRNVSIKNQKNIAKHGIAEQQMLGERNLRKQKEITTAVTSMFQWMGSQAKTAISSIQRSEDMQASVDVLSMTAEGGRIADESILDGTSFFTESEDTGNSSEPSMQFNVSDSFSQWYNDASRRISESKYSSSTKEQMQYQLDTWYWKKVSAMQDAAYQQSYAELESNFTVMQSAALINDAKLWAEYDGNLPEGVAFEGIANISSRSDFSSIRKQTEAASYLSNVRMLAVQDKATQIARTQGMAAADGYIQAQGFLSAQDKVSITALAQQSYNQMKGIYTDQADSLMTEAFTSGGSTPQQIYKEIQDIGKANGLPQEVVTEMTDVAREAQREAVSEMGNNTLQSDTLGGLSDLIDGRAYVADGNADAYFYGIPEEKDALIARYDAAIQEAKTKAAEDLDTSLENIEEMDKKVIDAFNDANDYAYTLFDSGAITGRQYGQMITSNAQAALGESQSKDLVVLNGWNTAFSKATDAYVENVYADEVKSKVEALLVAEGKINATKNKRTTEELRLLNDLVAETNGSILNALWDYGKKAVPIDSVLDYADKAYQSFVLKESVLGGNGESKIPLPTDDGVTMKGVISAAVDSNKKITSNPEASYVWYDHPEAYAQGISATSDDNGQITLAETPAVPSARFLDMNVEEEYRRTASVYRSQLAMALGISESEIADNPEAVGENAAIASPVFSTRDGRTFRCRGYVLQEFIDTGTPGDGQGKWEPFASIQRDGSEPVLLREDAASPDPASDDTGAGGDGSEAKQPDPLTISNESITGFIHVKTRDGGTSGPITGVEIDPALLSASNYTRQDIQRYILSADWGDGIRAQQVWRFVQPQLNRLEEEKRSR